MGYISKQSLNVWLLGNNHPDIYLGQKGIV